MGWTHAHRPPEETHQQSQKYKANILVIYSKVRALSNWKANKEYVFGMLAYQPPSFH